MVKQFKYKWFTRKEANSLAKDKIYWFKLWLWFSISRWDFKAQILVSSSDDAMHMNSSKLQDPLLKKDSWGETQPQMVPLLLLWVIAHQLLFIDLQVIYL